MGTQEKLRHEARLREAIIDAVRQHEGGLTISELQEKLRSDGLTFGRDELRSLVWRLAAGHVIKITPDSKIVLETRTTGVS